jgi:hypothetical protein
MNMGLSVLALLLVGACSHPYPSEALDQPCADAQCEGEAAIDCAVSAVVRETILNDGNLRSEAETIRVLTKVGRVIFTGSVSSEQASRRVEDLVGSLGGALRVDNRLRVRIALASVHDRLATSLDEPGYDGLPLAHPQGPSRPVLQQF